MDAPTLPSPSPKNWIWPIVAGAVLFGIAHTQAPLYFSNQHQYFLHGMAEGGLVDLHRDWLANTADPVPVFSALVAFTQRHLHVYLFHFIFFLLQMVYFFSLMAIGRQLVSGRVPFYVLGASLITVHAGIVRLASVKLFGVDYPWYFQTGLAGQYVLGPALQPSAFGVLLLASIAAFVYDRCILAALCAAVACIVHATYLLPASFFILSYSTVLIRAARMRMSLMVAGLWLLAVLPVVIHSAVTFQPTNVEIFNDSQRILADLRIPHHTKINRWLDVIAALQIAWILLALFLLRRTSLCLLFAIPTMLAISLTLLQWITQSISLSLLFPWRTSVLLVPIATTVIFANLAQCCAFSAATLRERLSAIAAVAIVSIPVAGGLLIQTKGWGYQQDDRELAVLNFIRDHSQPGDLYLLPVRSPTPSTTRGSVSLSFTAPPLGNDRHLIAVDLQRFRLYTGMPIYIDYKSIPYKDTDVQEWRRRLQLCRHWYEENDWENPTTIAQMRHEGINHLLLRADQKIEGESFELVYEDRYYRLYLLREK